MDVKKTYGWKRDLPDQRDFVFKTTRIAPLPTSVDLRLGCSAIEDQGNLGSCCSNAVAACIEFLEIKDGVQFKDVSRLFHYYTTRQIEGTVREDSGATLRDSCKSITKYGICSEKSWPYQIRQYKTKPTTACYKEAEPHKTVSYFKLNTINDMKHALADGFIFVIGISVYESFESTQVDKTGKVPMPKRNEDNFGGHAIAITGYNPTNFIFRNSWGKTWGDKGYGYLPLAYLDPRNGIAEDAWVIKTNSGF